MQPGTIIGGRYRLEAELDRGGMGSVWRAEHIELGHPVAIKLVHPQLASAPEAQARFKTEARAAASLRGAHVVQILDFGVDHEVPYIAMELLEGESLQARLTRQERLAPAEVVRILGQVTKAIERAHQQGIVHRDLKPDNIFLAREGTEEIAKVLDFGIAKVFAPSEQLVSQTQTGTLLGTPYYMSPEQASGRKAIDHRTDVWSIAIIAYECLTGRRPFADETLGGLVLSICTEEPMPASTEGGLPQAFDDWYRRSTAKDPTRRFQSVTEQMVGLRQAIGAETLDPQKEGEMKKKGPAERSATERVTVRKVPKSAPEQVSTAATEFGGVAAPTRSPLDAAPTLPSRTDRERRQQRGLFLAAAVAVVVLGAALTLLLERRTPADAAATDDGPAEDGHDGPPHPAEVTELGARRPPPAERSSTPPTQEASGPRSKVTAEGADPAADPPDSTVDGLRALPAEQTPDSSHPSPPKVGPGVAPPTGSSGSHSPATAPGSQKTPQRSQEPVLVPKGIVLP